MEQMVQGNVICITAIDTDIGKTIATGILARYLLEQGYRVITQKICQTGCVGLSQDILLHRKLMGIGLLQEDRDGLTCPYVLQKPCSPHLAAQLENTSIDCAVITTATTILASRYDFVLLEGVGGLMVPLLPDYTLADYLAGQQYFHLLVSCARLGSINHTLSALEIMKNRKLDLLGIIYNRFMDDSAAIAVDSRECFARFMKKYGFNGSIVDLQKDAQGGNAAPPDFSPFLQTFVKKG